MAALNQFGTMREVGGTGSDRTWRGYHTEVHLRFVGHHVATKALVDHHHHPVERHCQRPGRGFGQRTGIAGGHHPDPVGAQFDGLADWGVVHDPTVHQVPLPDLHRREHRRDRRAGNHRVHGVTGGQQHALAGEHVRRQRVQRDVGVLQAFKRHVLAYQAAQRPGGHEVPRLPQKPAQSQQRTGGKHLAALQRPPEVCQPRKIGVAGRVAGKPRSVDRSNRCADDQIRTDIALVQRHQHARLDRAMGGPSRQDECCGHPGTSPLIDDPSMPFVVRRSGCNVNH